MTDYGGVDSVVIHPRNLWIPDILLYNRSDPLRYCLLSSVYCPLLVTAQYSK